MIKHENVVDAGVIGIPNEIAGEVPKAYVVLKKPIDEKELLDYVNGSLLLFYPCLECYLQTNNSYYTVFCSNFQLIYSKNT